MAVVLLIKIPACHLRLYAGMQAEEKFREAG